MSAETKPQAGAYTGKWYDNRNDRRRERYHGDAEYREEQNKAAREGYRNSKGTKMPYDPRVNLKKLARFGTIRTYEGNAASRPSDGLSFTKAEVAAVFARPVKQVQQWAADGRIPLSVHKAKVEGKERNWIDVYTLAEVTAMVNALGPLLAELVYFRRDHVDAIKAVHEAIEKVR